jgi:hypothetical protein
LPLLPRRERATKLCSLTALVLLFRAFSLRRRYDAFVTGSPGSERCASVSLRCSPILTRRLFTRSDSAVLATSSAPSVADTPQPRRVRIRHSSTRTLLMSLTSCAGQLFGTTRRQQDDAAEPASDPFTAGTRGFVASPSIHSRLTLMTVRAEVNGTEQRKALFVAVRITS